MTVANPAPAGKILTRAEAAARSGELRSQGRRVVFTNGCFDLLHVGHVSLLHAARRQGDFLVVGLNSDASVRRLKGPRRPIHPQQARALVLAALQDVDAVCIFDEDTPVELLEAIRPAVHVKGGDYRPEDLPEAATVRRHGGEVVIVPLQPGYSTTAALTALQDGEQEPPTTPHCLIAIPARYGSTRFPGKALATLGDGTVIEHVVRAALRTGADRPILVATDDERIAVAVRRVSDDPREVDIVLTSPACRTGTDRLAEAVRRRFGDQIDKRRIIVLNVQGDEPFVDPRHLDQLLHLMRTRPELRMGTLATPIDDTRQVDDSNVVKVVLDGQGRALYFSRLPIPCDRDGAGLAQPYLRHLGVYAYEAGWLLEMAALPSTPLEEAEKLEQLRALENGTRIHVEVVQEVVNIAIDTPDDLAAARQFLAGRGS